MATTSRASDGLPPVTPPSGRFIAQLFLVPGIIVLGAVTVLWGFSWLIGASRTPEQFLKELSSTNVDVRRRAASDLSQVLTKDPALASNPRFALDLADLLAQALREEDAENRPGNESGRRAVLNSQADRETLEGNKRYVQFLISCLGNCSLPVGVPLLCQVAMRDKGVEPETTLLWRGVALWALANLGEHLKHLDSLTTKERDEILQALEAEAAGPSLERSSRAEKARQYLLARFSERPDSMGVERALEQCAGARSWFAEAGRFCPEYLGRGRPGQPPDGRNPACALVRRRPRRTRCQ